MNGFNFNGFDFGENSMPTEMQFEQQTFSAEGWGFPMESFFDMPESKGQKKAETSKKEVKKEGAKEYPGKKQKAVEDISVNLPVTVIARGFEKLVDGSGSKKISEIVDLLIKEGYEQFQIPGMSLYYVEEASILYVVDGKVTAADDDTYVDLTDGRNITVIDGLLTATFTAEDFQEKEADEITAKDIAERFAMVNPYYAGCKISYQEDCTYSYPVFDNYEHGKLSHPIQLMVKGSMVDYGDEECMDLKDFKEKIFGTLPSKLTLNIAKTGKEGVYVVSFNSYTSYSIKEMKPKDKSKTKKVETKYPLPLELYIVTFNCFYNLRQEHFDGKEKVTLEDIKKYMADKQKMFSDSSRKLDVLYNKEMNRLAVMFVSGSKGCEMIRTKQELEESKTKEMFHGFYIDNEGTYDVLALPHGTFITLEEKIAKGGNPISLSFIRKLPKIPGSILDDILTYFREDLTKEAMVRLVYHKKEKRYDFYKAGGNRNKAYMEYEFDAGEEYFSPDVLQVMEIHSHNTMPAFFSKIDDEDEKGYPGVFGVMGNIDRPTPSVSFRAGNKGIFTNVPLAELFEV